jgi:hypothetical protein
MKGVWLLALLIATPASARDSLGVFQGWGAFRDAAPERCFAIAESIHPQRPAFASVATWPGRGTHNQIAIRLSRPADPQSAVTLGIGERRFALIANGVEAWAPDARTDAAIVSAMRSGRSMSVEAVSRGAPFVDAYALSGAATAIDAAALACVGR